MAKKFSNTCDKNATHGLSRLAQILLLTMAIVSIAALAFLAVAKYAETFEAPNKTNLTYKGTYNVVYDGNGHTKGNVPIDVEKYNYASDVTVKQNVNQLEKRGYTFDGWCTNAEGTGKHFNPNDTFQIYEDTVLYAQWKADDLKAKIECTTDPISE